MGSDNKSPEQHAVDINVETNFLADQSDQDEGRFVFAYTITIKNSGKLPVQLLNRHWIITDASGRVQEVKGDGVVGKQPTIHPGNFHRYSCLSVIETPVGTMQGSYGMVNQEGSAFDAEIPMFRLAVPGILN
jgi:ApaG protein